MEINGTFDDRFIAVREAFAANFVERDHTIDDDGRVGRRSRSRASSSSTCGAAPPPRDASPRAPWERDTIINVWSTTKTVSALACLMLADQGEIDLYGKVATVWPEFAAGGKGDIEIRHLMSHTAGCPAGRSRSPPRTSTTGRR